MSQPEILFLLDGPYVSDYLIQSIRQFEIPVIHTAFAGQYPDIRASLISESAAIRHLKSPHSPRLYTNSENALQWLYENIPDHPLALSASLLKDKVRFRDQLRPLHPEYWYAEHSLSSLQQLDPQSLKFPLVLKPALGFFSLGVQRIEHASDWNGALERLKSSCAESAELYPAEVLDLSRFILEEVIPGEEVAIDCYFDAQGQSVILNLMQHLFASDSHTNDRIYLSSAAIMESYLELSINYLNHIGRCFQLRDFPAHVELRIHKGRVRLIEINPLRFGGWCSTPDLAHYAWRMNVYEMLLKQQQPDWPALIRQSEDRITALIVLDRDSESAGAHIKRFDYEALLSKVSHPLELRKADFRRFPLYGFLMCQLREDRQEELAFWLHSDLREFIQI